MKLSKAQRTLKEKFGYDSFRPGQKEAINAVMSGKDSLIVMPTGGGKSICYQLPALMLNGLTLVISPLIALMKDQVDALTLNGIKAAALNSSLSATEQKEILSAITRKQLKLLYVSPERLLSNDAEFLTQLTNHNISLCAIDEAHCISQWGHDFRPEYLKLSKLKQLLNRTPIMALTATADKLTRQDILNQLKLNQPYVHVASFNRPNINYFVKPKSNSTSKLLDYLQSNKDKSGIIYALSRKKVEQITKTLNRQGFKALPYHAGLDKDARSSHQESFAKDKTQIIVATIAFGMGIDKSNVRFVIHMDLPKNIESYYQETGRAGRDGLPSDAILFFSAGDAFTLRKFIEDSDPEHQAILHKKLQSMVRFGQVKRCRRKILLAYFDEPPAPTCDGCDVCLGEYQKIEGTQIAQKALSAVARLKGQFGASYTIDFLRGSKSQKIKSWHKSLPTYGVGKDISKKAWNQYFQDLVEMDYLSIDKGQYPTLSLTDKSQSVLKGQQVVHFYQPTVAEPIKAVKDIIDQDIDQDLFNQLKILRTEIATQENVPAYIVFSDATLTQIAIHRPQTDQEFLQISGIGEVKLKKYSQKFLTLIRDEE